MALPSFLASTRLDLIGPSAKNLNLAMQRQEQTQWCWSAVATSVSLFFDAASSWVQCRLANAELQQSTCCDDGGSKACNRPWYLDRALARTGNLLRMLAGAIRFARVRRQVNEDRPVGARVGWTGGGGHFVVLDGYSTVGENYVSVRDPWYGSSMYGYRSFRDNYQGSGSWTHTYFTQP